MSTSELGSSLVSVVCLSPRVVAWFGLATIWLMAITSHSVTLAADGAAATVTNPVTESSLTQIRLTPEAEKRLGIQIVAAKAGTMEDRRLYPGFAMAPIGHDVALISPIMGLVRISADGGGLTMGRTVKTAEVLLSIVPSAADGAMMSPSDHIAYTRALSDLKTALARAEGEFKAAEVGLEASRIRLNRTERLRQSNAAAQKTFDEATAEFKQAEARHIAATAIAESLRLSTDGFAKGSPAGVPIKSPIAGILADLLVSDQQIVMSGTPLVRITNAERLWVRVPIPVGDWSRIDRAGDALIGNLGTRDVRSNRPAESIAGPKTANPDAGSIDAYYELENDGSFQPGERLGASLPTTAQADGLVIPRSAVMIDLNGGDWVYERVGDQTFSRRRVEVSNATESDVLIRRGLQPGAPVVVTGATELFGVEFGAGK